VDLAGPLTVQVFGLLVTIRSVRRISGDLPFDVMLDGESFLMIRQAPEAIPTRIALVQNWFQELTRLVPTD